MSDNCPRCQERPARKSASGLCRRCFVEFCRADTDSYDARYWSGEGRRVRDTIGILLLSILSREAIRSIMASHSPADAQS